MPEARFDEVPGEMVLDNGLIRVEVHQTRGTYDIIDLAAGRRVLSDCAVAVTLRDGPTFRTRGESLEFTGTKEIDDRQGRGISMIFLRDTDLDDEPELSLTITLYHDQPFAIVQTEVQNLLATPIHVQSLLPLEGATLDIGVPAETLSFYKHGWQSWSPSIVLSCADGDLQVSPPVSAQGKQPAPGPVRFVSDLVTALADPAADYGIVAGFVSAADQFSHVYFDREPSALSAVSWADGVGVAPKSVISSESLYIQPSSGPTRALQRFGDVMALEMDALPAGEITSGWCSWYYYFTAVSEADIMSNLEFLAEHKDILPVEYVQIDDGYQAEIGDWLTTNDKFPNGMKWLADQIHARGYKAGLWLAPFIAGKNSRLFADHPDWFVQFPGGGPAIATMNWGQLCHCLDLTHPEVLDWLRSTFRTISQDWGYDYVKIDFIYGGAVDGVRRDKDVTRAQAYRRGLETIRDVIGPGFILACGNPMGPSVGLVDGARIGPDVAPWWRSAVPESSAMALSAPSALNSIRNAITRFWMHNRLWANDPDCLLVRETDTQMSGDEVRALATVIGLTGGMVLDSDNLPKLSDSRREIISQLLPVYGRSAVPLDLFRTPGLPTLLSLDCGTHTLLAVFNWSDESAEMAIPLPDLPHHVFEFWEREYLGVQEGSLTLPVPPHGCRLLRLSPDAGRPQVVGSSLHITIGAMEIGSETWDGEKLSITLRPVGNKNGELFIARDGRVQTLAVEGPVEQLTIEV
jgi:alpha-galactosidase